MQIRLQSCMLVRSNAGTVEEIFYEPKTSLYKESAVKLTAVGRCKWCTLLDSWYSTVSLFAIKGDAFALRSDLFHVN